MSLTVRARLFSAIHPAASTFLATAGVWIRPATITGKPTVFRKRVAIGSKPASGTPAGYKQNGTDSHIVPDVMLGESAPCL